MHAPAALSLTSPAMMLGLLGLILPVAAHLTGRLHRRHIVFPATHLLAQTVAAQPRLRRLRRLLLLALRCLAVAAIVLAFARPLWTAGAAPSHTRRARNVIIVLDASASTAQQVNGISVMQSLRGRAADVLARLEPGRDRANLIRADADPEMAFGRFAPNLNTVRRRIDRTMPTDQRAALSQAVQKATDALAGRGRLARIVIVSDLQRTNWPDQLPDLSETVPRPTVEVLGPEATAERNTALSQPRARPGRPLLNRPCRLSVAVTNHGNQPNSVPITCSVGGRIIARRSVRLSARQTQRVTFEHAFSTIGAQRVRFRIPTDALPIDDISRLAVRPVERTSVVLVSDADAGRPGSGAFFLTRALRPDPNSSSRIELRTVTGEALRPEVLGSDRVVILGEASSLDGSAADLLRRHVRRGGGLLIFGGALGVENLRRLNGSDGSFLPWTPKGQAEPGSRRIGEGRWSAEPLRVFDPESRRTLRATQFAGMLQPADLPTGSQTLLRYRDGIPALSWRRHEKGAVALANFGLTSKQTDLPTRGVFVALVHSLVSHLRGAANTTGAAIVGEPQRCRPASNFESLSSAAQPTLKKPHGGSIKLNGPRTERTVLIPGEHLRQAGFYGVRIQGQQVGAVAVNVDPRESDLRATSEQEAQAAIDAASADQSARRRKPGSSSVMPSPVPLWPWLMLVAAAALAGELILLSIWPR